MKRIRDQEDYLSRHQLTTVSQIKLNLNNVDCESHIKELSALAIIFTCLQLQMAVNQILKNYLH